MSGSTMLAATRSAGRSYTRRSVVHGLAIVVAVTLGRLALGTEEPLVTGIMCGMGYVGGVCLAVSFKLWRAHRGVS